MSKSSKTKPGAGRSATRRGELRRNLPKPTYAAITLLQQREFVRAALILLLFIVVAGSLVVWSRGRVLLSAGQIVTDTRLNRLDFTVVDVTRTEEARREARERAPDVYTRNTDFLDALRSPLRNLPVLIAQQQDFQSISLDVISAFALDEDSLTALAVYAEADEPNDAWTGWVDRLLDEELAYRAIVESEDWQRGMNEPEPPRMLGADGNLAAVWSESLQLRGGVNEARQELRRELDPIVRRSGFPRTVARYVAARIASTPQPTYVRNDLATTAFADERAAEISTVRIDSKKGDPIYQQLAALRTEQRYFAERASTAEKLLPALGVFLLTGLLVTLAGALVFVSYPRVMRNALRIAAIGTLMASMLALAIVLSAQVPQILYPAAIATTLFVAIILLLSYDQRLALALSTVQCLLTGLALGQGIGWFAVLLIGCGTVIGQLREVRNRNSLIRAALVTAAVIGMATLLLGVMTTPPVEGMWVQIIGHAASALAAAVVVGFLVLGILPSIERLFDITTGMTLAELRDPSQTLLRQLQQRAPGTYNHSLQVANIAEAAAEAIGADGLLVYVGALYHDIGKMNKPEYFVENQAGGFNKHSKLRPAMSLLLIIGHVKDGIELAREYGLPRTIQHFIESHHGTTLVEYFYHAAKTEAETDEKSSVDEVEFRYPGPRPRTKEAAILMLADAVESATRAMTEPNPSRIENLVRKIARKRLLDAQFDDCDLTFRELSLIEDAMIARLCAVHHGRISYPTTKADGETDAATSEPAAATKTA